MSETVKTHCIHCGSSLPAGAQFCPNCGLTQAGAEGQPAFAHPQPATMGYAQTPHATCSTCGGNGAHLPHDQDYCPECRWLRPLSADFRLDVDAFMWSFDADGMRVLNSLGPVSAAAKGLSERFGRPVFEAAVNGIRLSEHQMPEIFLPAVRAARLMGLTAMPEIYVSGERLWDAYTLGGDSGAFIALGSVLTNFSEEDLFFLLARQMAHIRAGHVYWNTALEFLMGQRRGQATIMGEGIMQFLNPVKMVESAVEAPLMAWARHAEITADRAALLVTGDIEIARRVLTQWTLKSFPIYGRINERAWRDQEAWSQDPSIKMSEWTLSTTPFLAPRMKVMRDFEMTADYQAWRAYLGQFPGARIKKSQGPGVTVDGRPALKDTVRMRCPACREPMRIARSEFTKGGTVTVRCPHHECGKPISFTPPATPSKASTNPGHTPD